MTDTALLRVLDAAGIATARIDVEGRVTAASPAFARTWGRSLDEVCGAHLVGLCPDHEQPEVLSALVRMLEGVVEVERHDLRIDPGLASAQILQLTLGATAGADGGVEELVAVLHDITAPHRAEQRRRRRIVELTREATEDTATGLPNQRGFDATLASAIRRSARTGCPLSVMHLELAGLDATLARLDPLDRDVLIDTYVARLTERLRPSDDVSRVSGDSFMVVAEDLCDVQDAAGVAYRLLSAAVEPIVLGSGGVALPMTIGVAVGDGAASAERLTATASRALDAAREQGPGEFHLIDVRPGLAA